MRVSKRYVSYSSHLPLLIKMISLTDGPVLELGTGLFSTPVVHWLCTPDKRKAVSYEHVKEYYESAKQYENEYHSIKWAEDWDKVDIEKPWDVVFIDHEAERRSIEARRVANYAKFVILHDSDWKAEPHYHYETIYPLYKYKYQLHAKPKTSVVSNFIDVTQLNLWK